MNYPVVLIGTNHYNTLGAVRSLREENIDFHLVITGNKVGKVLSYSRHVKNCVCIEEKEVFSYLKEYEKNLEGKAVITTTSDVVVEILDEYADELKGTYILPIASQKGNATLYMDKMQAKKLAQKNRLDVVQGHCISKDDDLSQYISELNFPCITKSSSSTKGGKSDIFICRNEADLQNALDASLAQTLLVEPLVAKENELCFFGIAIDDEVYIPGAAKYLSAHIDGVYGGCFDIISTEETNRYISTEKLCQFVKEIGYKGVFGIEFLIDKEGCLYFLEINMRVSAFDYGMKQAGCNLIASWARQEIDKRPFNPVRCIVEFLDFKQQVLEKKMSLWSWFKQLRTCQVKFYCHNNDKLPFFGYIIDFVFGKFVR